MERAAFASAYANKKLTSGIFRAATGAFGNTATRLASFIVKGGSNVYGSYPDIDKLFPLQADELDPKKRAAILEKISAAGPREGDQCADLGARLRCAVAATVTSQRVSIGRPFSVSWMGLIGATMRLPKRLAKN